MFMMDLYMSVSNIKLENEVTNDPYLTDWDQSQQASN